MSQNNTVPYITRFSRVLLAGVLTLSMLFWVSIVKAQNVSITANTTVPLTVAGTSYNFTVLTPTSFDLMTVGSTNLTVTIPAGSTFLIRSSDRLQFNRAGGPTNAFFYECATDASTMRVTATAGTGAITTTITPGLPPCDPAPSGSGFTPASLTPAPAPAPAPAPVAAPLPVLPQKIVTTTPPATPTLTPAPVAEKKLEPKKAEKKAAKKVVKKTKKAKKVVKKTDKKKVVKKTKKAKKVVKKAAKKVTKKSIKKTVKKSTKTKASEVSTQPKTDYIFTQFLSAGSSGEEVRQLQLKLQAMSFMSKDITPNSNFGTATTDAVKALQKAYGLDPLGYVGPGTRDVLNK